MAGQPANFAIARRGVVGARVVLVSGARQSGKSTLVRLIAEDRGMVWRTLDNEATRRAAAEDPAGFVDVDRPLVVDEIQRVPELLLAIKELVDRDYRPGRFDCPPRGLSGSAAPA